MDVIQNRINNEFLIDPFGKVVKFKGSEEDASESCSLHNEIAKSIVGDVFDPIGTLIRQNWIRVGGIGGSGEIFPHTQAQYNTLYNLGIDCNSSNLL